MKRGKRGQFYLIAAIIIIIILFGVALVANYARTKPEETVVYDLQQELDIETGKVWDWAIYNDEDIDNTISNWTETYVNAMGEKDIDNWVFVYGDADEIKIITFQEVTTGIITINYNGGESRTFIYGTGKNETSIESPGEKIKVTLNDVDYDFTLGGGQKFIFLIEKGEYVAGEKAGVAEGENV